MAKGGSSFFEAFRRDDKDRPTPPQERRGGAEEASDGAVAPVAEASPLVWVFTGLVILAAMGVSYGLGYMQGKRKGASDVPRLGPAQAAGRPEDSKPPAARRERFLALQLYTVQHPTKRDFDRAEKVKDYMKEFARGLFPNLVVEPYVFSPPDKSYLAVRIKGFAYPEDSVAKEFLKKVREARIGKEKRYEFRNADWLIVTR